MIRVPKVNLHTHTTYCDGKESVESMIQAAIAKDFIRLGFSGHVFNDFRPEDQESTLPQSSNSWTSPVWLRAHPGAKAWVTSS